MKTGTAVIALAVAAVLGAAGAYYLAPARAPAVAPGGADGGSPARKLLYYRNPMGLPDTSPVPKKDPMGMDYIPVYEGEADGGETGLRISPQKVQKLGVKTALATLQAVDQVVRANGRVEADEGRIYAIAPKFEGYIEHLWVNTTGQPVSKGQPLFEVYSPELVSAQQEYALAAEGAERLAGAAPEAREAMEQLAQSSLLRLKNWDISEAQLKALRASGQIRRTLTFRAPVTGVVTEKKALQGMRFMPGESLFQVTDLSRVWVQAEVFEQDLAAVRPGQRARVGINAYPGALFEGTIAYVYPTLNPETRAVPVRIELANPGGRLKPAMYADVEIPVAGAQAVVTVPASAVLDSGRRQVVLIQQGEGHFEPRPVRLGRRGSDWVEVREGVREGETVVVSANFLIDAESNLKAALAGMESAGGATPATVGHQAEGVLRAIDAAAGTVTVSHGPVASLNWPAMKMDFVLANPSLVEGVAPGSAVRFEFVERQPGEWVITALHPAGPGR